MKIDNSPQVQTKLVEQNQEEKSRALPSLDSLDSLVVSIAKELFAQKGCSIFKRLGVVFQFVYQLS